MVKNEIHARLSVEMMEKIRQLTVAKSFPTISHTCRWLLELGITATSDEIEYQPKEVPDKDCLKEELPKQTDINPIEPDSDNSKNEFNFIDW